uniref:Essential MCU regulator, mitochondrial n=1 Tax=Panagrolaimus superbus TaxID=310955 RepID=A0A914Y025_9BILA
MLFSHFSKNASILLFSGRRNLSHLTTPAQKGTPIPSAFYTHNHGLLKVSFALIFSVYFGSTVAKLGAAALEENEIFVHFDDEEDE